jgi:nitrate/nitrite transport system ATP-binding protein
LVSHSICTGAFDTLLKRCSTSAHDVTHDIAAMTTSRRCPTHHGLDLTRRVLLMSNGPRAQVAEAVVNTLPKRRQRETIHHDPQFYRIRNHLVDFLVRRSRQLQAGLGEPRLVSPGIESERHASAGTGDGAGRIDAVAPSK